MRVEIVGFTRGGFTECIDRWMEDGCGDIINTLLRRWWPAGRNLNFETPFDTVLEIFSSLPREAVEVLVEVTKALVVVPGCSLIVGLVKFDGDWHFACVVRVELPG